MKRKVICAWSIIKRLIIALVVGFGILVFFVLLDDVIWEAQETPFIYVLAALATPIVSAVCIFRAGRIKSTSRQDVDFSQRNIPQPSLCEIDQAAEVIFRTRQASVSMLQRELRIRYSAAAGLMDALEKMGVVSSFNGSSPRAILISRQEYYARGGRHESGSEDTSSTLSNDEFYRYGGVDAALLTVDMMEGHQFEYWCADVLEKNGFTNVEVTQGSGDQGVDVLAQKGGIKYAIQCKCYEHDLGNKPVQEINTGKVIYHCHVGVVMTNRYFTKGATEAAEATGVLLWDRDELQRLIKAAKIKAPAKAEA